jgi:hypothetical protein
MVNKTLAYAGKDYDRNVCLSRMGTMVCLTNTLIPTGGKPAGRLVHQKYPPG